MVYLAKFFAEKKVISLKTISEKEGIPFDYLGKVISELEKTGLVKAKKGIQGGYFLVRKPQKITAGEVVKILERTTISLSCLGCQRTKKCLTKNVWKKVQDSLDDTLNSITLKSLIK